jgi:ankyrin repeat protein
MIRIYLNVLLVALLIAPSSAFSENTNNPDVKSLPSGDHFLNAVFKNQLGRAQLLLQEGVDINYRSPNRQLINTVSVRADRVNQFMGGKQRYQYASGTAYDIALSQANTQTVKWLLQKGANPASGFFKSRIENTQYASFYPASFLNLPYRERAVIVSVGEVLALAVEENDVQRATKLLQIEPRAVHYRGNQLVTNVLKLGKWRLANLFLKQGRDLDQMVNLGQLLTYPLNSEPTNYNILQGLLVHAANHKSLNFYPHVIRAMEKKDSKALKMLIAAGATLNPERHRPPLFIAAEQGDLSSVQLLLALGADPDQGYQTRLLLHDAVSGKKLNLARVLLEGGADASIKNRHGATPLSVSIHQKAPDMTMLLLGRGADVNIADHQSNGLLHTAVNENKPVLVKALISRGAPINHANLIKQTALFLAVKNSKIGMVNDLIRAGANPNIKDRNKQSALQVALSKESLSYALALIKAKADVNVKDSSLKTPLMIATEQVRIPLMKHLLKAGAKVDEEQRYGAKTALYIAIEKADLNMIRLLLEAKASVNTRTDYGQTALHLGVAKKHLGIVNLILNHKPQIDVLDNGGSSALHNAVTLKNLPIVKRLLQAKARPNSINDFGGTPLITALSLRRPQIAQALINAGANLNVITNKRQSPLDIAIARGLTNVARMLVAKGGKTAEQIGSRKVMNVKLLK